jgi:hypothetical protein
MKSDFRLYPSGELDKLSWDKCISTDPQGGIYQLSFYLDAVAENWMGIVDPETQSCFPLCFKSRPGFSNIYQPFFARYARLKKEELLSEMLEKIPEQYRHVHFCMQLAEVDLPQSWKKETWIFQELEISGSMEHLRKAYSENTRRMLKKAHSDALRVKDSENVDLLIKFFQQEKGADIRDLKSEHYERLRTLMKTGIKKGLGRVVEVSNDQGLMAIGFFWYFNGRITYLKGTSNAVGRSNGAMFLLFDHVLQTAPSGFHTLDFGGSRIPNIAGFYKKFGAKDVAYTSLQRGEKPLLARWGSKLKKIIRK